MKRIRTTEAERRRIRADIATQRLPLAMASLVRARMENLPQREVDAAQDEVSKALASVIQAAKRATIDQTGRTATAPGALYAVEAILGIGLALIGEALEGAEILAERDAIPSASPLFRFIQTTSPPFCACFDMGDNILNFFQR